MTSYWHDTHVYWHFIILIESLIAAVILSQYYDLVPILMKPVIVLSCTSMLCLFVGMFISTYMTVIEYRDALAYENKPYIIEQEQKIDEFISFPAAPIKVKEEKQKKTKLELLSEHPEI